MYDRTGARENSAMRAIHTIVLHHSASASTATVHQIDGWHRQRGFRRHPAARAKARPHLTSIGYHRVIDAHGDVHEGRALAEDGAHAHGANGGTIGVCLIGNGAFTRKQWAALEAEIDALEREVGRSLHIVGHREVTKGTECPGFDVAAWRANGRLVPQEHVR